MPWAFLFPALRASDPSSLPHVELFLQFFFFLTVQEPLGDVFEILSGKKNDEAVLIFHVFNDRIPLVKNLRAVRLFKNPTIINDC